MMKPEQVPHAAMNALLLALRRREGGKEAIAAAINAWPGMFGTELEDHTGVYRKIILPLPKEKSDA